MLLASGRSCAGVVARLSKARDRSSRVVTAGTFYEEGRQVFWDVHHPENTVIIDLRDDRYQQLIAEVGDPSAAAREVTAVLLAARKG